MENVLLAPGNLARNLAGLSRGSDHRQVLRIFVNTLVWGTLGVSIALAWSL